jgi:hypothetical protein
VTAVAALLAVWVLAPAAVPIYDGLSNPDEPYRYVNPPAGAKQTPAPTDARATLTVSHGSNDNGYANSKENAPQVSVFFPNGALSVPSGVTSVDIVAAPEAPSAPLPSDGTVVGNVYRVSATANGKTLSVVGTGNAAPTLQMRAPSSQYSVVFEHRTAHGWEAGHTIRIGYDRYQTAMPALGDWALVKTSSGTSGSSSGGVNVGLLAGGIGVLVLAGVIVLIRVSRSRRSAA